MYYDEEETRDAGGVKPEEIEQRQYNTAPSNDAVKDFLDGGLELPFHVTQQPIASQIPVTSQKSVESQISRKQIILSQEFQRRMMEQSQAIGRKLTKEEVIQIIEDLEKAEVEERQKKREMYLKYAESRSNVLLGVIGALIGTLIGAAAMVFLDYCGTWSGIASCFLFPLAFIGYCVLGRGATKKGVVLCVLLTAPTVWIANQVGWTVWYIDTVKEAVDANLNFMDVLPHINDYLERLNDALKLDRGDDIMSDYFFDVIMAILFYFFGIYLTLKVVFGK